MSSTRIDDLDIRVRDALTSWKKLDTIDVKILEGVTQLGPRNLSHVAKSTQLPHTTVRFRVSRMTRDALLFLHLTPNTANMGLKRAVVFIEAAFGYETSLMDFLKINDFWMFLCPIYGQFEGSAGIWAVPYDKAREFQEFLKKLQDAGVARKIEVLWTTSFHNVSVSSRWFDESEEAWAFDWDEWLEEAETIEGELPSILVEPKDWPVNVDYTDLLIIKELENDARMTLPEISDKLEVPLSKIKYHYHEHVLKRDLVAGYQVEIYRFPFPLCEILFFKFEFDDQEKLDKFALSLLDKPIAINIGKVLGKNELISHIFLPKWQLRRFIRALSILAKRGRLKKYTYYIQDMYNTLRETIPYEHFKNNIWTYNHKHQLDEIKRLHKKSSN